jgi:hypothetical protein
MSDAIPSEMMPAVAALPADMSIRSSEKEPT